MTLILKNSILGYNSSIKIKVNSTYVHNQFNRCKNKN